MGCALIYGHHHPNLHHHPCPCMHLLCTHSYRPCLWIGFQAQLRFSSTQGKTNPWSCSAFSSSPQGKPTNPIWAVWQPSVPPPPTEGAAGLRAELRAQRPLQEIGTGLSMKYKSGGKRVKHPDLPLDIHTVQCCFLRSGYQNTVRSWSRQAEVGLVSPCILKCFQIIKDPHSPEPAARLGPTSPAALSHPLQATKDLLCNCGH